MDEIFLTILNMSLTAAIGLAPALLTIEGSYSGEPITTKRTLRWRSVRFHRNKS